MINLSCLKIAKLIIKVKTQRLVNLTFLKIVKLIRKFKTKSLIKKTKIVILKNKNKNMKYYKY